MERPGSRGNRALAFGGVSKAPTGNPIAPPPRPSTPVRGSGDAQVFAGSSQCAQRIGTGFGRIGTPLKPGAHLNSGLQSVGERPVTQQGMAGIQSSVQGPGRQVLDKSFYMNLLRAKKQEIIAVNDEMRVRSHMHHFVRDNNSVLEMLLHVIKPAIDIKKHILVQNNRGLICWHIKAMHSLMNTINTRQAFECMVQL